jgi:Protein of unknown function (DUF3611)
MLQQLRDTIIPSKDRSLARAFFLLGWGGFWLQVVFGSFPALLLTYYFLFSRSGAGSPSGVPFLEYLTIINLLMLLVTIYWSYRYTRLSKQIMDPEKRPPERTVVDIVWIGVLASAVSMLFSMIVLLIEAANMLFFFLRAPQGGIPVIQTAGAEAPYFVSSVEMVSLMALILTLFAELIVLLFSLWLLFRTTLGSPEFPQPTDKPSQTSGGVPQVG